MHRWSIAIVLTVTAQATARPRWRAALQHATPLLHFAVMRSASSVSARMLNGLMQFIIFSRLPNACDLLAGTETSRSIIREMDPLVQVLKQRGIKPHLAVLLVGDRRDSATYVRMKQRACEKCGITATKFKFEGDVTEEQLLQTGAAMLITIPFFQFYQLFCLQ